MARWWQSSNRQPLVEDDSDDEKEASYGREPVKGKKDEENENESRVSTPNGLDGHEGESNVQKQSREGSAGSHRDPFRDDDKDEEGSLSG